VLGGLVGLLLPTIVRAEHYLDFAEAARVLFPDADAFAAATVEFDRDVARRITDRSGMRVRKRKIESLLARSAERTLGFVYLDEVIGKHEFITYTVGVASDGSVRGVEILDYRETWGGAIREAAWRAQFRGRSLANPLRLGQDVQNVSGATLSCRNVTDGVRRILATHAELGR
jgi:Na+-translocating ferredoxin:NAD+ oxidoreductase RnfG subunit